MSSGVLLFVLGALCCVSVIAMIAVLAVVGHRNAERRRHGFAAYAAQREWEYARSDPSLVTRFRGAPFGRGSSRQATNVLRGRHDRRPFVAFDYRYTTSSHSGDTTSSTNHSYSVIALHLGLTAPPLSVAPSGALSRFINQLTKSDIPVGDPVFDRAFTVKCASPDFARDVLHPQLTRMLMQWPALAWRFEDDSLLVVRGGVHQPGEVDSMLQLMAAILGQVPSYVWDRLGPAR